MIVEQLSNARHFFGFHGNIIRQPPLEILHCRANFRVIGEQAHYLHVLIQARMTRICRQQDFFLFAKMHVPGLVPEFHKLFRLALRCRCALLFRRLGYAAHAQRLNQREMVVLAQGMRAGMALHGGKTEFRIRYGQ